MKTPVRLVGGRRKLGADAHERTAALLLPWLGDKKASLNPEGESSAQSFQRFLKRPAASSVYRTVFEMFLWPRYACKVRVSVPWSARA